MADRIYTLRDLRKTVELRRVVVGKVYIANDGKQYIGVKGGNLEMLPEADQVVFTPTTLNEAINVQEAIESINDSQETQITATEEFTFLQEDDEVIVTIESKVLTIDNLRSFTVVPIETDETSLDDFKLNGVVFNIENIVDLVSFDIRATALNGATGVYTVIYKIIYS